MPDSPTEAQPGTPTQTQTEMQTKHNPFVDPAVAPAEDLGFRDRRLPGVPTGEARGMLPGMAMIGMFMLFVAMTGVLGVFNGHFPGNARYFILPLCTFVVVGVFGLFRLRRWGWALVLAGCLMMTLYYVYVSRVAHNPGMLVMAGLTLVFFLYLSRPEVRERLR